MCECCFHCAFVIPSTVCEAVAVSSVRRMTAVIVKCLKVCHLALNQAKWIFRRNELLKSVSWCTKTQACWYICCIIFSFYWNTSGLKRVIKLKRKKEKKNLASVGILFVFSSVFKVCFLPSFNMLSKDCTTVSFSVVKEGAQCSLSLSCVCLWFLQDDAKMPSMAEPPTEPVSWSWRSSPKIIVLREAGGKWQG